VKSGGIVPPIRILWIWILLAGIAIMHLNGIIRSSS
jgi:hypothetical protein